MINLESLGWGAWSLRTETERLSCLAGLKGRLKELSDPERQEAVKAILHCLRQSGKGAQTTPMLTWDQVREMRKDGMTMGAHTISHKILTKINLSEAQWEIEESKHMIEQQLGEPIKHFAYPNGTTADWNPEIIKLVEKAGFETACTTVRGTNPSGQDVMTLRRVEINDRGCLNPFGKFSVAMFEAQMTGLFGGWKR
jgi:Polysaccharide deacetylase